MHWSPAARPGYPWPLTLCTEGRRLLAIANYQEASFSFLNFEDWRSRWSNPSTIRDIGEYGLPRTRVFPNLVSRVPKIGFRCCVFEMTCLVYVCVSLFLLLFSCFVRGLFVFSFVLRFLFFRMIVVSHWSSVSLGQISFEQIPFYKYNTLCVVLLVSAWLPFPNTYE